VWATTDAGFALMTNVTQNATQNINPQGYAIATVAMDASVESGNTAYVGIMDLARRVSDIARLEDYECGRQLDGLEWNGRDGTARQSSECFAGGFAGGVVYAGTDVGVFVSLTSVHGWTEVGPTPGAGFRDFCRTLR